MDVIPVIDIMDGIAVHARAGDRQNYRPLHSRLATDPSPWTVLRGLLRLYPFPTVYLADLDALRGKPAQCRLFAALLADFPQIRFWVDRGFAPTMRLTGALAVIGSESLMSQDLQNLPVESDSWALSLDQGPGGRMDAAGIFERADLWPTRVILMNLGRVGTGRGPDVEQVAGYRRRYQQHTFIAAGGVRDHDDLERLAALGVSGVLVASALHDGRVAVGQL